MGKWRGLPHEPMYLCGAKARSTGKPCRQFAMKNGRCYLHGGKSSGAKEPRIKHGMYTKEAIEIRKQFAGLIRDSKYVMKEMTE